MACFRPLLGYRSNVVNPRTGKRSIVFNPRDGFIDLPVVLPCGRCIGCRLERSRQWAIRCVHEASLYSDNCFITLTYSDDHLPDGGALVLKHYQDFMKRLRFRFLGSRKVHRPEKGGKGAPGIRFFHCGEYGEKFARPHYHACLFNFDFPDKKLWSEKRGHRLYTSAILEKLWPFGFSTIGDVTFESAAYVARYIMKKVTGEPADAHYGGRPPEYVTMSRGGRGTGHGGIGKGWYEKFNGEVYPADSVVMRGREMKPPKFYDRLFEIEYPTDFAMLKIRRKLTALEHERKNPDQRLGEREYYQELKSKALKRGYENET